MKTRNKHVVLFFYYVACIGYTLFGVYNNSSYAAAFWQQDTPVAFWQQHNPSSTDVIDHAQWQAILDEFLIADDPSGVHRVNYVLLKERKREKLTGYLEYLTSLDPRLYNREQQFAYWINLYNALTVDLIVRNYPVKSITKLGESFFSFGPWDDVITVVAAQELTLNDIEHQILRVYWDDHRIHFAVNCASLGCPNIQATAFTADNMEALLDASAKQYLSHSRGLRFVDNKLVLSEIFDWYKEDFGDDRLQRLVTLSQYLPAGLATQVRSYEGDINYEYDWSLNEP